MAGEKPATEKLRRELGFRDVLGFYVVTGLSLRWIATAAASGQSATVVWLLAFAGFFLPLAGCVLELSSRFPQEGGLYVWTREAYGDFPAFIAAWSYWMSNLPYFPAILYFAAGSFLFAAPGVQHLANTNLYYMLFTVGWLAFITVLNVLGLSAGKWLNNLGAVGLVLPVAVLITLGVFCYARFGSATHFTLAGAVPHAHVKDLVFWSTIFFAFGGCETVSFMGEEVKDPRRTVPRALLVAGAIIVISYIAGTLAMLVALPSNSISGLGGFMTVIDSLCRRLGMGAIIAPVALLVAISNVGAAGGYLTATARLPFVVGIDHYLPAAFAKVHPRWRTPHIAIISYGLAGILFGLLSQAGTSVKGAYDLLVSMAVITYFIPYLFLFAAMIRLRGRPSTSNALRLPLGQRSMAWLASVGIFSTAAAIVLALFPTEDEPNPVAAFWKLVVMTFVLLAAGVAVYWRGHSQRKALV
jgi:amino acid transporter